MEILYITWGMLLFLFIGMLLSVTRERGKVTQRRDSATDPMFRRPSASGHR
jgi:hypothetical protein